MRLRWFVTAKPSYISREELIGIADYIQTAIVEAGKTAEHLPLVNAIMNTCMPCLNYPRIARELERITKSLAKSNAKSQMEPARAYSTLWSLTLKSSYLTRLEKTVRHCYFTLANDKSYPDLGIDKENPRSLATAVRFLAENRKILHILSSRYDLDNLLRKYQMTIAMTLEL